jgi:hypothetical protein
VGDAWAGNVHVEPVMGAKSLHLLGRPHGIRVDPRSSPVARADDSYERFLRENAARLEDPRLRVVALVRFKMALLCYLLRIPQRFGLTPWSPFLDPEVAMAMLNLPASRRADRRWQRDLFARVGLDVDDTKADPANWLDLVGLGATPLPRLDKGVLAPLFEPSFVERVDAEARLSTVQAGALGLARSPLVSRAVYRGIRADRALRAYAAYICLWPMQRLLVDEGCLVPCDS